MIEKELRDLEVQLGSNKASRQLCLTVAPIPEEVPEPARPPRNTLFLASQVS